MLSAITGIINYLKNVGALKSLIKLVDIIPIGYIMCISAMNQFLKEAVYLNSYDDKVRNRVKRMEGQLRGILKMMDEGKDCKDVITQLSAVRSGVDRSIGLIVSQNLIECIQNANGDEEALNESVQEAVNLFVKSR